MTITYNSTLAFWQPKTLDVFFTGALASNFSIGTYVLLRDNDYPADAHTLTFQTGVCELGSTSSFWG